LTAQYHQQFRVDIDYSDDTAILVHKPCKTYERITDMNLRDVIVLAIRHTCPPKEPKEQENNNG